MNQETTDAQIVATFPNFKGNMIIYLIFTVKLAEPYRFHLVSVRNDWQIILMQHTSYKIQSHACTGIYPVRCHVSHI